MIINLKVKTLDAKTHEFTVEDAITVRQFKDKIAEKTNIAAEQQRIIFCGRVLPDEKQLKEFDVEGKVVHVAERPPPLQRATSSSSSNNDSGSGATRTNPIQRSMRNSPLYRTLDGMVVGTMAIPINAGSNGQVPINPFNTSSSFCMNRITVARHMLTCADNIAAYLEDPSRGLNNQPLDILARGRWTMESTVVEVGIAADMPHTDQNIVEMVQGAVSAALRRSGNTNVTVLQLPTVFGTEENSANGAMDGAALPHLQQVIDANTNNSDDRPSAITIFTGDDGVFDAAINAATAAAADAVNAMNTADEPMPENASNNAENVDSTPPPSRDETATATPTAAENTTNNGRTGDNEQNNTNQRRRTGTRVLAEVVEQMRNVQQRLNPFIQQFYELLLNDTTYDNPTDAENAQRLYDRVSEAIHYISHAQHAISDLMLDVSQTTPRYLTCRPILVEQSGYVSSNNYLMPTLSLRNQHQQAQQRAANEVQRRSQFAAAAAAAAADMPAASSTPNSTTPTPPTTNATPVDVGAGGDNSSRVGGSVEDPIDEPMQQASNTNTTNNGANAIEIVLQPRPGVYFGNPNHSRVARLIEAVVNSTPAEAEFRFEFSPPDIVAIGVPAAAAAAAGGNGESNNNNNAEQQQQQEQQPQRSSGNNVSANDILPRIIHGSTATLPTTSTQTRSTSRPQLQIGNLPGGGRFIPASMMSSFDRFLPCNSHHIREPESSNGGGGASTNNSTSASTNNGASTNATVNRVRAGTSSMASVFRRINRQIQFNTARVRIALNLMERSRLGRARSSTSGTGSNANAVATTTGTGAGGGVGAAISVLGGNPDFRSILASLTRAVNNNSTSNNNNNSNATTATARTAAAIPAAAATSNSDDSSINTSTSSTSSSISCTSASNNSEVIVSDTDVSTNNDSQSPVNDECNLRKEILRFVTERIFEGGPINDETIPVAIDRAVDWLHENLVFPPDLTLTGYNSRDSLMNIMRRTLHLFIDLVNNHSLISPKQFKQRMESICEQFCLRLYSVLDICIGQQQARLFYVRFMEFLLILLNTNLNDEALQFLCIYINPQIPENTDPNDAAQFIVKRNLRTATNGHISTHWNQAPMDLEVSVTPPPAAASRPPMPSIIRRTAAERAAVPWRGSGTINQQRNNASQPLLNGNFGLPLNLSGGTTVGAASNVEPWRGVFPETWVPIVTRDIQLQAENPPRQPPFSDGYINSMVGKRRKIYQCNKPPTNVKALLGDTVQKAMHNAGVAAATISNATSHTPEAIVEAITSDAAVQASFTESVRTHVRERLKDNSDYFPEKYPNVAKFMDK